MSQRLEGFYLRFIKMIFRGCPNILHSWYDVIINYKTAALKPLLTSRSVRVKIYQATLNMYALWYVCMSNHTIIDAIISKQCNYCKQMRALAVYEALFFSDSENCSRWQNINRIIFIFTFLTAYLQWHVSLPQRILISPSHSAQQWWVTS